jgi:hypothetical protein
MAGSLGFLIALLLTATPLFGAVGTTWTPSLTRAGTPWSAPSPAPGSEATHLHWVVWQTFFTAAAFAAAAYAVWLALYRW